MTEMALSGDPKRAETETDDAALPSVRVIDAVAAATGADPMEMDPLYDVVDPDALDQLFAAGVEGHVCFELGGHAVTVRGDGSVEVDGGQEEV